MIEVRNLTKKFGRTVAVDNISFDVGKGEVLGFLGPNGAGKTTTMRMLTCYLIPDSGTAKLAGYDILENPVEVRERVGYLPENAPLYLDMDVVSYLEFVGEVRGIPDRTKAKRIVEMVEVCGLGDVVGRKVGELSKGYKQRVGLAQTLIHDPEILILDEPTTGLDPTQIIEIRGLIKEIGRERTVILSSHILPEVEATCSRVLIINEGRLAASGTPDELQSMAGGGENIYVSLKTSDGDVVEKLSRIPGVISVSELEKVQDGYTRYLIKSRDNLDMGECVYRAAVENRWMVNEIRKEVLSLEDIFLKLITKEK